MRLYPLFVLASSSLLFTSCRYGKEARRRDESVVTVICDSAKKHGVFLPWPSCTGKAT
ncbi:hypothetical protein VFPPC_18733 [Pochonia chlamydosporia 170]|uniref:Lipoprotein n=1 Tax=Pochonia chlamydosporia 170 TaxID=1380566 RepID=A0A219ARZ2_METCM|nr:hypothetical protein VFPPC_18733 [Pochonia chlamydosporia 170]OWT43540.1 hypothetical protein VFPPC_18733 [Pochonia chlamydosporia 170]